MSTFCSWGFKSPLSHHLLILLMLSALGVSVSMSGCSRPEGIVLEAADAARRGDKADYLACFTPRSAAMLEAMWQVAGPQRGDRFGLAAGDVQVRDVAPIPPGVEGIERVAVTLTEGGAPFRLVVHEVGGAWRIDLIDTERALTGFAAPF